MATRRTTPAPAFDLDAAVADSAGEPFRFTWGGQSFTLPHVMDLAFDVQTALIAAIETIDAKKPDPTVVADVFKLAIGEQLLAELSRAKPLSTPALVRLVMAWIEFHGDDLGKSPASVGSSASTAKPSKATSRSARARKTSSPALAAVSRGGASRS